jgi:IK cytokine
MDLGNKKGQVGKWDFDTNEEYSSYMSKKEALPKAAFQFGVKMNDGRKTRRTPFDPKVEKQKIDKEWYILDIKLNIKHKNIHSF